MPAPQSRPVHSPRRLRALVALVLATALGGVTLLTAPPAYAATMEVRSSQQTGTPTFDATDGFGYDSSLSNDVIRVNDVITYSVVVAANGGEATGVSISTTLPKGYQMAALPQFCASGSVTPAPAAPVLPITTSSWQALPQQVVTCTLKPDVAVPTGTAASWEFPVKVRSELLNGASNTVTWSVTTNLGSGTTAPLTSVVSSGPRWDISVNGIQPENTQFIQGQPSSCSPWDPSVGCFNHLYPISLLAPNSGKGAAPLAGPVTFTVEAQGGDLYRSPAAQARTWSDPATIAAYAPHNPTVEGVQGAGAYCGAQNRYQNPGAALGSPTTAVRSSGTITCAQPAGRGGDYTVTIANADTSLHTFPTVVNATTNPDGTANNTNRGYAVAVSGSFGLVIPGAVVRDLGVTLATTLEMPYRVEYTTLNYTTFEGVKVVNGQVQSPPAGLPSPDDSKNSYLALTTTDKNPFNSLVIPNSPGTVETGFVGVPGTVNNTPGDLFSNGYPAWEGLPEDNVMRSGDASVSDGQVVLYNTRVIGDSPTGGRYATGVYCTSWSLDDFRLAPGAYPGGTLDENNFASGGRAVWYSGSNSLFKPSAATANSGYSLAPDGSYMLVEGKDYVVEYSTHQTAGAGADSGCSDGVWYGSLAAVPGGADAVNGTRILLHVPWSLTFNVNTHSFATALRVAGNHPDGDVLPVYSAWTAQYYTDPAQKPADPHSVLTPTSRWTYSEYNPTSYGTPHTGRLGDRVLYAPSYARVDLDLKGPDDSAFTIDPAVLTNGDLLDIRLQPRLENPGTQPQPEQRVLVETCLPNYVDYVDSFAAGVRIEPETVALTAPTNARITCATGQLYVRYDLGLHAPDEPITPILLRTRVRATAATGFYPAQALITAGEDVSTRLQTTNAPNWREVSHHYDAKRPITVNAMATNPNISSFGGASIAIEAPSELQVSKVALHPLVWNNPTDKPGPNALAWLLSVVNLTPSLSFTNLDIIDTLPVNGRDGNAFTGGLVFGTVEVLTATQFDASEVTVLMTRDASVERDPQAASNGAAGATDWCRLDGSHYSGDGAAADCAGTLAQATAIRLVRAGELPPSARLEVRVTMLPTLNHDGDVYVNTSTTFTTGSGSLVASDRAVVRGPAGTASGVVWSDEDRDGVREAGEPPLSGVPVRLNGVDAFGVTFTLDTTTDAAGGYRFTNLPAGEYWITVTRPAGLIRTSADVGDPDPATDLYVRDDAATDSDVILVDLNGDGDIDDPLERTTASSRHFIVFPGEDRSGIDAGFLDRPVLNGRAWDDVNRDGIRDPFEPLLEGVRVTITGRSELGDVVNQTVTTDALGRWSVGLFPSNPDGYTVTYQAPSAGREFTTPDVGSDEAVDSDVTVPGGSKVVMLSMNPGLPRTPVDAGYRDAEKPLGGAVWIDADADGIRDPGETPVPGTQVTVWGVTADNRPVRLTAVTDADGVWSVPVVPGRYQVAFSGLPPGMSFTRADAGDDALDSDVTDPVRGFTDPFVITAGTDAPVVSAGLLDTVTVPGSVWTDSDADGIRDADEAGIGGVKVVLVGTDGFGNPVSLETMTDASGNYTFTGVLPGTYEVVFDPGVLGAGGTFTTPNGGDDDAIDSDVTDTVRGSTGPFTITPGAGTVAPQSAGVVPASQPPTPEPSTPPTPGPTPAPSEPGASPSAPAPSPSGAPRPPGLPQTGTEATLWGVLGGVLLVATGVALIARRRRRD